MWRCICFCCKDKVCAQQRGEGVKADRPSPEHRQGSPSTSAVGRGLRQAVCQLGWECCQGKGKGKRKERQGGGLGWIEPNLTALRDCRTSGSAASQDGPAAATCAGRQSQGEQTCMATTRTEEQWPVVLSSSAASKASPRHCWLGEQLLSTGLCVPGRHAGMGTGPFQQSRQENAAAATADAIATAAICLALRHCCRGPSRAAAAICTRLGTAGTPSPGLQVPSIHTTVKALTATFTSALCVCQQNIHSKQ